MTKNTATPNKTILTKQEIMCEVLRGEMAATEAYREVMEKIKNDPESIRLKELLDNHQNAVDYWTRQVRREGFFANQSSGPWGTVVGAFVKTAKLLGNTVALKALKEGEEYGIGQYERLLKEPTLSSDKKDYIENILIPSLKLHISSLEAMMKIQ